MNQETLNGAIEYAKMGLSVVPLHGLTPEGDCSCGRGEACPPKTRGKHPLKNKWASDEKLSPADLYAIWEEHPWSNVGLRTGDQSGFFVIDVDTDGVQAMQEEMRVKGWKSTRVVTTGSGFWHFYFQMPEGVAIGNSAKSLPQGVDVRGNGGLVVAPPSVSFVGPYSTKVDMPPATAPDWLIEALKKDEADVTPIFEGAVVKRAPNASEAAFERNLVGNQLSRLDKMKMKPWVSGDSWDQNCFEIACHLVEMANAEFSRLTLREAHEVFMEHAPHDDVWDERKAKWTQALRTSGNKAKVDNPLPSMAVPAMGTGHSAAFIQAAPQASREVVTRITESLGMSEIVGADMGINDSSMVAEFCRDSLLGRACYTPQVGWLVWSGTVWIEASIYEIRELFRRYVVSVKVPEARQSGNEDLLKAVSAYLQGGRIKSVAELAIGIMLVDYGIFDKTPDLLTVGNGTVNLRTGELYGHAAHFLTTKSSPVNYIPGARHDDWDSCLRALRPDAQSWFQLRIGQAATGHPTTDDVLPMCHGDGSNGKTAIFASIRRALGDYAVVASERMLLARPGDHPTEMMPLHGARLALVEETPQGAQLNVKRLKDIVGSETMVARKVGRDNITWDTEHSLFVTTNHRMDVADVDHGTWRRLALLTFPYRFLPATKELVGPDDRHGDPRLKPNMREGRGGRLEAVLAWIVEGAIRFYAEPESLSQQPASVVADTLAWRGETDKIFKFMSSHVVFDPEASVLSVELFRAFSHTLEEEKSASWSDQLFARRLTEHPLWREHGLSKVRTTVLDGLSRSQSAYFMPSHGQHTVIRGLRFRDPYVAPPAVESSP